MPLCGGQAVDAGEGQGLLHSIALHAVPLPSKCPDTSAAAAQVAKVPELAAWNLYLVDWGYNTEAERSRAAADPRIELVDLAGLSALAR